MPEQQDTSDTITSNTAQHPASVDAYIRHGWSLVPIPPGTKGPNTEGWNRKENALTSSADLKPYWGIGLAHAYSGTMALDIDHWDRAALELMQMGLSLDDLYNAPDAVVISSGRAGHGKLLYAMPFGLVLPSKKLSDFDLEGSRYCYLDFRCGTFNGLTAQDVLPPSIHPDTLAPYRWAGLGHWQRLPLIPQPLLDFWLAMTERDSQRIIPTHDFKTASWDEIRDALEHVDPSCDRETWIQIGMALHYVGVETGRIDEACGVWNDWSMKSPTKYKGAREITAQWRSLRADKRNMVRLGTLFHFARLGGWVRPKPDVAHLFAAAPMVEPETVTLSLEMPPPAMDLSLWPDALRARAEEVAEHRGCDPLVPLFAGLGAICGAVDARTRLELMPGFKVPPVLWLMTIGDPGDKKSPGSRPMLGALRSLEIEDRPNYARELLRWEGKQAAHETAKKAFLEWSASPESLLGGEPPAVPDMPDQPASLKICVNDITSQKLVREAALRPRGLLCALDEMSAWVTKLTDTRSGEDRSSWVVAYEAEPYVMDRVGAGSIVCDNFAVSMYGNIQPEVFRKTAPMMSADGLLQRFIPAVLRWERTKRGDPVPEEFTLSKQWESLLRLVYALPAMTYKLSPEAYTEYREFQNWYEVQKKQERLLQSSNSFMTAYGKIEGTCGRLALVLHLIENPFAPEITKTTLDRAIAIIKSYVIPALRYTLEGLGNGSPMVKGLADWVICNAEQTTVTIGRLRTIAQKWNEESSNRYSADNKIIQAMAVLDEAGWTQRLDDGSYEYRDYAEWAINPLILTQFNTYREQRNAAIAERKQQVSKSFGDAVGARGRRKAASG